MKFFFIALIITYTAFSQEKPSGVIPVKPTPVEFLLGHNRIQGQTIIIKNFKADSKFGIFSLTTLAGDYKNVNQSNNELFSNVQLLYDFYKGLKVATGATFSSAKGFVPIAGFEYSYVNPKLTVVLNPTINLVKSSAIAGFGQIEYAPKNKKLSPYARLQGLYVQSLAGHGHERSAVVLRAGVMIRQFSLGLGINQDFYGPTKILKPNTGLFLQYKFI